MSDLSRFLSTPTLLLKGIAKERDERRLINFVADGWHVLEPGRPFVRGWIIDAICEHLEAVTDGDITRLLVNVPPGSLKSLSTGVFFPAWEWGPQNLPSYRYLTTSYKEDYAKRDARRMRDLVQSPWFMDRWGDRFKLTRVGEASFANDKTGWREALPFASLTAGRGDRVIIDDPHSTEGALSDTDRQKAVRIFLESVPTRVNDPEKSAIIIIMQRLHSEDVSGVALSKELGYEHLMVPMEYDPGRHCVTVLGYDSETNEPITWEDPRTEEGELMFPERFPRAVVERDKIPLGKFAVASQFQQMPVPRGGGIIQREWWQLWGNPDNPMDEKFRKFPTFDFLLASVDTAFTEKEENDFSALTVWGIFRETSSLPMPSVYASTDGDPTKRASSRVSMTDFSVPRIMLVAAWHKRLGLNDLVTEIAKTCRKFKVDRLLIENKASGIPAAQEIERLYGHENWGVELIDPKGDKTSRVYAVEPLFSGGMIYAPYEVYDPIVSQWKTLKWVDDVITEMVEFPKGAHDDFCDSTTQAISWLKRAGMIRLGAELSDDIGMDTYNKGGRSTPLYPS